MNNFSSSSFTEYLFSEAPQLINDRFLSYGNGNNDDETVPHGTTIVAVIYKNGVIIAGDRRATMGNIIANHLMKKVFIIDDYTAVGFAGTVGIAIEILRLYSIELEHYEKMEGRSLSFAGKVNKLAEMVRRNFSNVQLGLVIAPLLVGYDHGSVQYPQMRDITNADSPENSTETEAKGKIVSFDVLGSRYEEIDGYYAVGSGSLFARSSLKKTYRENLSLDDALAIAVEALVDAAEEDSATGGPDILRHRYPLAIAIDQDGAKGIARGKSVIALSFASGVIFVAENPSRALHKVSELYDRIGFAAVGKYNEFEALRRFGIQRADRHGYEFDRSDVSGQLLANFYALYLGTVFTEQPKPYEVELCVAEVSHRERSDSSQLYRISYDGSIVDESNFVVMGGASDGITAAIRDDYRKELDFDHVLKLAVRGLSKGVPSNGNSDSSKDRVIKSQELEVAILDRTKPRRAFSRVSTAFLHKILRA